MAFDAIKFVDSLELTPDQRKLMDTVIPVLKDEKVGKKLESQVMAQSDYSRSKDELKTKLEAAEAEQKKSVAYFEELKTWRAAEDTQVKKAKADAERATAKLAAVQGRVEKLKADYAIEDEHLKGLFDEPTTQAAPKTEEPAKSYLTQEDFTKQGRTLTQGAAMVGATIFDLARRHKELFGTDLSAAQLTEGAIKAGKSLEDFWRESNKVGEREDQLKTEKIRAEVQKEFDDKERARISELSNPAARVPVNPASPVLAAAATRSTERKDPNRGVIAAVNSYREKHPNL